MSADAAPLELEVLICTHNRAALLQRCLGYLDASKQLQGRRVGVLVVANACGDGTERMLSERQGAGGLPLRWLREARPGKSYALNTAIAQLRAPWVAMVDDDHRIDPRYLAEALAAPARYPGVSIFCGRILPDWDGWEPVWAHDLGRYAIYPLPVPRYDQGPAARPLDLRGPLPGGGNLVLRRDVFARVGGFSTDLGPRGHDLGGGEDSDFVQRALQGGERLHYVPAIVQHHYVDTERFKLRYLLQKSYQRSRSVTRVRKGAAVLPPRYLWRKLFGYGASMVVSLHWPAIRFYLMRTAAVLGEISAYLGRR